MGPSIHALGEQTVDELEVAPQRPAVFLDDLDAAFELAARRPVYVSVRTDLESGGDVAQLLVEHDGVMEGLDELFHVLRGPSLARQRLGARGPHVGGGIDQAPQAVLHARGCLLEDVPREVAHDLAGAQV